MMSSKRWWSMVVCFGMGLLVAYSVVVDAGCLTESRMCCDGKNNSCRREGPRVTNNESFTCFCDAVCGQLGDCCTDYRQACQAVDCILAAEWTDWSTCEVSCGNGFRRRQRGVSQRALNGGKECKPLVDKEPCSAEPCQVHDQKSGDDSATEIDVEAVGLAKIIPVTAEEPSSTSAVLHRNQNTSSWSSPSSSSSLSSSIGRHHHLQRKASNDDEYDKNDYRNNYYNGNDINELHKQHQLHHDDKTYFAVFELTDVRSACQLTPLWPRRVMKGVRACVECHALAARRRLGNQCKGHGMTSRETRWVALTIPGCHGKWTLTGSHTEGSCRGAGYTLDFLFV